MTPSSTNPIDISSPRDQFLTGSEVSIPLPGPARRYFYHGWQSWSLAAWVDLSRPLIPMRPARLDPGQSDPLYRREKRPHGSWLGAVELENGQVVFLGALGLGAHVALDGDTLKGWYESDSGDWFTARDKLDSILAHYAEFLKDRLGTGRMQPSPRVWCSWYSLYTEISENSLLKILDNLQALPRGEAGHPPFDTIQVDDGWQQDIGDWEPNAKFPSGMHNLAMRIKSRGFIPGLWLAPLIVTRSSTLYRQHKDWLLHDERGKLVSAGHNWGQPLYALDTTHPEAAEWLRALMQKVRAWGYDYVKLDFLYGAALPGKRCKDIPREQAYRQALQVIREALGEAYFLACGAPILPSIGLCDGMRVGPDVSSSWRRGLEVDLLQNFAAPGGENALRTTLNRLWLQPVFHTDPDVVYFGVREDTLTDPQQSLLQDLAAISGFKATSEIPSSLAPAELESMVSFMSGSPQVEQLGPYRYRIGDREVDFAPYIEMPPLPGFWANLAGWLLDKVAELPFVLAFVNYLWQRSLRKKLRIKSV